MIICIGESLIDFVPQEDRRARAVDGDSGSDDRAGGDGGGPVASGTALPLYRPVAGGSPLSTARSRLRDWASEVAFAGAVSRDFFGDQLVRRLRENEVSLSLVTRVDRPTTLAFVKKEPGGAARYAFFTNGAADRALSLDAIPQPLPSGALLQMGSISLIPDSEGSTILELAEREHGSRVIVFDPNIRERLIEDQADYRSRLERAMRVTTVLKTSDEDLSWIYPVSRRRKRRSARVFRGGARRGHAGR